MLVGNKADLDDKRVVPRSEGRELAAKHGMPFEEASALDGTGVAESFVMMARKVNETVSKRVDASLSPAGRQRMLDASMSPSSAGGETGSRGGGWGIRASVRGIGSLLTKPLSYLGSSSPAGSPAKPPEADVDAR